MRIPLHSSIILLICASVLAATSTSLADVKPALRKAPPILKPTHNDPVRLRVSARSFLL